MAVPIEGVVREVLARHDRDVLCRRAVEDAWDTVKREYPNRAWYRRKSTTRALVWEHSVKNAVANFDEAPGVAIIPVKDTYSFLFDDTVLVRFKKANTQFLSSNYPTLSALLFHRHDRDLFGHEGHHRVEVAHIFDRLGVNLSWVGVIARDGRNVLWTSELRAGGAIIEQFPVQPELAPVADRVLRPAESEARETDESERE